MASLAPRLLAWFDAHGRHDLPWQLERTPYSVWVSEIMLQQTQVATVIPLLSASCGGFPPSARVAAAQLDDALQLWWGTTHYARARNLHRAAQIVVADLRRRGARARFDALVDLPGIQGRRRARSPRRRRASGGRFSTAT
jgi:A/G-specific adenine glycosylase